MTDDVEWILPGVFYLRGKDEFDKEIENPAFEGKPSIIVTRMIEENNIVIAEGTVRAKKKDAEVINLVKDSKTEGKYTSLAVFKPTSVKNFIIRPAPREWNNKQKAVLKQLNLFEKKRYFEVVRKLPFKFSYVFTDHNGHECTLMNEDWELGALYWRCLNKNDGDEDAACNDVKKKYLDDFARTKDLYFYLGTTKLHHLKAPNPFIIIGTFHPKIEHQLKLGL